MGAYLLFYVDKNAASLANEIAVPSKEILAEIEEDNIALRSKTIFQLPEFWRLNLSVIKSMNKYIKVASTKIRRRSSMIGEPTWWPIEAVENDNNIVSTK